MVISHYLGGAIWDGYQIEKYFNQAIAIMITY